MVLDNKGVLSAELIFVTLIFVIIAGSFISLVSSGMDNTQTADLGQARMIGERIAGTINMVYRNGDGYSANLTLPDDFDYKVHVYSTGNMSVVYNSKNINIKLIPTTLQSFEMNEGTTYQVKNDNGTIIFT